MTLHRMLELPTNIEYNNQNNVTIDNYIEIPKNVINYEQLSYCEFFTEIKQQYINYINQLADLYNYFTETHTDDIAKINKDRIINSSINKVQFYEQNKNYSKYETLFYSYNNIRKSIYNIINYLSKYKNETVINNETAIVCGELKECLDICLEGFNSKIIIINDYIEYISSNNFDYKIKCKLKNLIQNKISEVIIAKKKIANIHSQTAFFNLIATDYNFDLIVDSYANLYDYKVKEVYEVVKKVKNSMSQYDVCIEIVNELYSLFKELLIKINKEHWLNHNIITDFTSEHTNILKTFFIEPINKYLVITDTQELLSIRDIICEQPEGFSIYLADIKDVLHFLIAKNLRSFANFIPSFKEEANVITVVETNLVIKNVNNCYFYIVKDNQEKQSLQLQHIQNTNILKVNKAIYTTIFMQALAQTKPEDIYKFLNSTNINKIFFNNKHLVVELNNNIKYNQDLKKKLISAILYSQTNQNNKINYDLCMKFIQQNILIIDILNNMLENHIDDFFYILSLLTLNNLYEYIATLTYNNIKKIIKELTAKVVNVSLQEVFYLLFKNHKWQLLEAILTSEIKFTFFNYLTKNRQLVALKILLDNSKEHISSYFLLDYINSGIKDNHKNNILHVIVNNNSEELLLAIIRQIPLSLLGGLLLSKNNDGFSVLMSAVKTNNIRLVKILMPYCNLKIISSQSKIGSNALMLAIKNKNLLCFQELAKTATTKTLTAVNKDGNNILMQAIINKCDDITNDIIERLNNDNLLMLKQYNNYDGDNALGLAISYKSVHLVKIIDKSNLAMLMHCNKKGYNSLMLAAMFGITDEALELLLQKIDLSAIYKQTFYGDNALILAATYGNANIIKFLFKRYYNKQLLNIKNINGDTAMMMAAEKGSLLCLQQLLDKATAINLVECGKNGVNILILATRNNHHECVNAIIEKYEQLISTNKINYDIWRAIEYALFKRNFSCLESLLTKANTTILTMVDDESHYNNLMMAVACCSEKCINAILNKANSAEREKMLNQQDSIFGKTAIMIAIVERYNPAVIDLLKFATPEMLTKTNNTGYNSLMFAINEQNTTCIQAIVEKVNSETLTYMLRQKSKNGSNAIIMATKIGFNWCLSYLLEHLTEQTVDILLETDNYNHNALIIAILHHKINCFVTILKKIEQFKKFIGIEKYENIYKYALILALKKNYSEYSTLLLQYATTKILVATDDQGHNSLMIATSKNNNKVLAQILEKDNSDMQLQKSNKDANTAITIATIHGYILCLNLLLAKATPEAITATNIYGHDALMLAVMNDNYNCMIAIINKLDTITFRQDINGDNAIMHAVIKGRKKYLQKLLEYSVGTKVLEATNNEGNNCLMLAIKHKRDYCMGQILKQANSSILQQKNNNGDNAMKLAKKYHRPYYNLIIAKQNNLVELDNR